MEQLDIFISVVLEISSVPRFVRGRDGMQFFTSLVFAGVWKMCDHEAFFTWTSGLMLKLETESEMENGKWICGRAFLRFRLISRGATVSGFFVSSHLQNSD